MKKKNFNFKKEYLECFDFIKKIKEHIYSAILIFAIFGVIAFFFHDLINSGIKSAFGINLTDKILNYIEIILMETEGMSQAQLTGYIFLNNVQSAFMGVVLGIFLGIFSIFAAVFNGYLLGFVGIISVKAESIFVLWRILPHGIFELPAIFISLGLGLKLGSFPFSNEKNKSLKKWFINSLRIFLLIVIPLLIVAAVIEGGLIALGI